MTIKRPILSVAGLLLTLALLAPPAHAANVNFAAGSLIVPMDTDYQDNGMLRAYGLVDKLLRAGVAVSWAINPNKVLVNANLGQFTADFTASARDLQNNNLVINAHAYRGGPFVIDSADAATATPLITAYQAMNGNGNVKVHVASAMFTAPVAKRMTAAPRIGVIKDGYQTIAYGYLAAAGIVDSTGAAFGDNSPDALATKAVAGNSALIHNDGALFRASGLPDFCDVMTMHYDPAPNGVADPDMPEVAQEVVSFVQYPVHFNAECLAIGTMEGQPPVGGRDRLLTPAGFLSPPPAQPMGALQYSNSFLPFAQMDGTFTNVNGAIPALQLPNGSSYYDNDVVMVRPANTAIGAADLWMTGYAFGACSIVGGCQGNVPRGKVSYLAGHNYTTALPISANPTTNGTRLWLNSLYETGCVSGEGQPAITVTASGPASTSAAQITITLTYKNAGPGPALAATLTDKLPANTTFVSASNGGVNNAGTVTWNLGDLPAGAGGTVTLVITLNAPGTYVDSGTVNYQVGLTRLSAPSNSVTTIYALNQPNVIITETAPASSASPTITYSINYQNIGTGPASNVIITDAIPPGSTFVSASNGCAFANGVVTCTVGNLAAGAMGTITITVLLPAFGSYSNNAGVTYTDPMNNPLKGTGNTVTTVYGPSNAQLQLAAAAPPVTAVSAVTFTITYTNAGAGAAQNVVITDKLANGVTFVSAGNGGVNNAGTVTWNVGNVPGGTTVALTVAVTLGGYGTYQNQASATYNDGQNNQSTASNTTTTVYGPAAPSISLLAQAPTLVTAPQITLTVNYANNGNGAAAAFVLSDTLPVGATFVSASNGGVFANGVVTWNLGTVATGGSGTVTVVVNLPGPGTYLNSATAAFNDLQAVKRSATSNTTTTVFTPAVQLTASAPANTLIPTVTFTINYLNTAATGVTNLVLTDALPVGATFVSASNNGMFAGGTVTWNLGNVAAGAGGMVTVTLTLPSPGTYPNSARANYLLNNAMQSSTSNTTSTVYQGPNVTMNKTGPATTVVDSATYTITYANAGPGTAVGLVVSDPLPVGATFVSASNGGVSNAGVVTWTVGDVVAGGSGMLTVTVRFPGPGMYTNVASATFTPGNKPMTVMSPGVTTMYAAPSMTLTASAPASTVSPMVTFSLTYLNTGASTLQGLTLADALPMGATFVGASNNGMNANGLVTWSLGDVPAGGGGTVNVMVQLGNYGTYMNSGVATYASGNLKPMVTSNMTSTVFSPPSVTLMAAAPANTNSPDVTFTITYRNSGPSVATGLVITDPLPAGAAFVAANGGGMNNGGTVTWNVGDVQPNGGGSVTVDVKLGQPGTYQNKAGGAYTQLGTPQVTMSNVTTTVYAVVGMPDMAVPGGCKNDSECGGATPACEPWGMCGQCSKTNLSQCTGQTPACNTAVGLCVLCVPGDGDAGGNASACAMNSDGHACEVDGQGRRFCGCDVDSDCGAQDSGRVCDGLIHKCVDGCSPAPSRNHCPVGKECTSNDLTGKVTGICTTACTKDGDCVPPRPYCLTADDAGMGLCVACRADPDCGGVMGKPFCSSVTHECVGCRNDGDCAMSSNGTICLADGHCGCNQDAECGAIDSGRVCDTTVHACGPGCRGMGGNHCPASEFCSSIDNTIGSCGQHGPDLGAGVDDGGVRYALQGGGCAVGGHSSPSSALLAVGAFALLLGLARRRRHVAA